MWGGIVDIKLVMWILHPNHKSISPLTEIIYHILIDSRGPTRILLISTILIFEDF